MKKKCVRLIFLYWCLIQSLKVSLAQSNTKATVKVGVVLDVNGSIGKIGLSCIHMALSQFYLSHPHHNTTIVFRIRDSHTDVVSAASHAADLIRREQVQAIIGPTTSMEANFVTILGDKAHVPILSFSAISPSFESPYFFQFSLNDSTQVNAISAMVQAFGWKAVVPIYEDDDHGGRVIHFLINTLQQADVRIPYLNAISPSATDEDIRQELYKLMTMQTRVFVVHMSLDLGCTLFTIAHQIGMMGQGYVWILMGRMANLLTSLNSSVIESMHGVLGVRAFVPKTKELHEFKARWKRKFIQDNPTLVDTNLNIFGLWAYDTTTALAMAVEKAGTTNPVFLKNNASTNLTTDLENLEVSLNGDHLREALSNIEVRGLSGDFNVIGGQLQASALEIINVIGNGERRIGFWTSENGLVKNLNSTKTSMHDVSKKNLVVPIIWPGDTYSVPKGWDIPANGKKMRIGVPVRKDYTEFVKITRDPRNNTTHVTGFCIDVFKAVLEVLPYALPYEFIPFAKPNGESAGTYNELISQVYYGNFDAVVGDVTILANRSNYVDFTLPYTESGVTMIVPLKHDRKQNAWDFLKPLTWELWVTAACSFIFIGFVVWVLEHRINDNFRGPPSYQIGTSLWFSFSTMVSAHREKVMSNLGRFVVIIWIFVVLILVQSYTASLTSMLTVDRLSPTITDVHQLINKRLNVGCKKGSFEQEILKDLGVQDYQFRFYDTREGCNDLLTKGSENGGIAAAFGEIPYLKLFLATYCSKYAMVDPQFKTGGFGFVFPKESPLVADISRAILNVTQGDKLKTIENAWLKNQSCTEYGASVSSNSLGLDSFWGLFLIAGVTSVLALTIFATTFLYQYRHIWLRNDGNISIWKRIQILLRMLDQRDDKSHTLMKKSSVRDKTSDAAFGSHGFCGVNEASLITQCPPSPYTTQTDSKSCNGEQGILISEDYGDAIQHTEIDMVQNVESACTTTISSNTTPQRN